LKISLRATSGTIADTLGIPVRTIGSYEREEAQPSPKFLAALIEKYNVNANWLLTGNGNMFLSEKTVLDVQYVAKLQERYELSEKEISGLLELLESKASREMVLKFIEIKKGNKEALDVLINNLQGIKAIYD
jgi:transcriptional regulator with XRE-family HTH domain